MRQYGLSKNQTEPAEKCQLVNYLYTIISAMCTPTLMLHRNEIECTK